MTYSTVQFVFLKPLPLEDQAFTLLIHTMQIHTNTVFTCKCLTTQTTRLPSLKITTCSGGAGSAQMVVLCASHMGQLVCELMMMAQH